MMSHSLTDARSSVADPDEEYQPGGQQSWRRGAGILTASTILIGLANYAMAIAMARLLSADEFSRFAAGQSLLIVLGAGSMAALPWAVSHYMSDPRYRGDPSEAMNLGLLGSVLQGVVLGAVAFFVATAVNGIIFGSTILVAVITISLLAGPVGYFQGRGEVGVIAVSRLAETAIRLVVGLLLVLTLNRNATAALVGFPVGSAAAVLWMIWRARSAFPLRRPDRRTAVRLLRQATLLGAIQILLAMLGALDTVYISFGHVGGATEASYQSAALIGRIPLFLSSAVAVASYTFLVKAADDGETGRIIRSCLSTYAWLLLPFVVACSSVPRGLFYAVIPASYKDALPLLAITSLIGAGIGAINVLTTAHQARERFARGITILVLGTVGQAICLVETGRWGSITQFAVVNLLVVALTLATLVVDGRVWLRMRGMRVTWRVTAIIAISVGAALMSPIPVAWLAAMTALTILCLLQASQRTARRLSGRHHRRASS